MFLETVRTPGIAQLSYVLGEDGGACVVVDPRRDVGVYLRIARDRECRIALAVETHVHADFVSGVHELAARTGCTVAAGATGDYGFEPRRLADGDLLEVGGVHLRVLHTPGHSPEHVSLVVEVEEGRPWAVFTGDTLFAGSVGRPDLAADAEPESLARDLWRSLTERLMPLGDEVLVLPGHGKGSPCGPDIGDRETTTVGYERRHSELLQADAEDAFVRHVLEALGDAPSYYGPTKERNARGEAPVGPVPWIEPLDPEAFRRHASDDALVLDGREIEAFGAAHVEGAINVALRDLFPVWAGRVVDPDRPLLLVLPRHADVRLAATHLHRIGYDRVQGWLVGGMRRWIEAGFPYARRRDMSVHELHDELENGGGVQVLDVRTEEEWGGGHVPGAVHRFVPDLLEEGLDGLGLDGGRPIAVYCGSGYRASLAASLLARRGHGDVRNVPGSWSAWTAAGYPVEGSDDA